MKIIRANRLQRMTIVKSMSQVGFADSGFMLDVVMLESYPWLYRVMLYRVAIYRMMMYGGPKSFVSGTFVTLPFETMPVVSRKVRPQSELF